MTRLDRWSPRSPNLDITLGQTRTLLLTKAAQRPMTAGRDTRKTALPLTLLDTSLSMLSRYVSPPATLLTGFLWVMHMSATWTHAYPG